MAQYRYLLCDLLTDQLLAVLPLSGVSFGRRISRAGVLRGQLSMPDSKTVEVGKILHENQGRAALWVYRGRQLWWGGIPWNATPQMGARGGVSLQVSASTFDSYAHRRRLYSDLTYTGVDQGEIIPDLWRTIQADPRGDIGVVANDQPTGVLRDRTYKASEMLWAGKLIEDMGDVIDGPEHTIDVYVDADGNRVKELRVAQTLGSPEPRMVFQRAAKGGGRVAEWSKAADAMSGGTVFQVRGDVVDGNVGVESEPLLSTLTERADLLGVGYPLLDVTEDRPGVTDADTLNGYADALAAQRGGAVQTAEYVVEVGNTGWSPSRLGEAVRVKMSDLWHTPPVDLTVRPVGCDVIPGEKGKPETVKLLLEDEV